MAEARDLFVIHIAGAVVGGVQLCTRCGAILDDVNSPRYQQRGEELVPLPPQPWPVGKELMVHRGVVGGQVGRMVALVETLKPDRDTSDEVQCG